MATINIREDEPLEKAIRRFKKMVENEGIVREFKNRRYFVKPSAVLHQKKTTLEHKNFLNKKKAQRAASKGDRQEEKKGLRLSEVLFLYLTGLNGYFSFVRNRYYCLAV